MSSALAAPEPKTTSRSRSAFSETAVPVLLRLPEIQDAPDSPPEEESFSLRETLTSPAAEESVEESAPAAAPEESTPEELASAVPAPATEEGMDSDAIWRLVIQIAGLLLLAGLLAGVYFMIIGGGEEPAPQTPPPLEPVAQSPVSPPAPPEPPVPPIVESDALPDSGPSIDQQHNPNKPAPVVPPEPPLQTKFGYPVSNPETYRYSENYHNRLQGGAPPEPPVDGGDLAPPIPY